MSKDEYAADLTIRKEKKLVAAAGVKRIHDEDTAGVYEFDKPLGASDNNRFLRYQQLESLTPHVSIPLQKLCLSITKGLKIAGDDKAAVEEFKLWSKTVDFPSIAYNATHLLLRDGTFVAIPLADKVDTGNDPEGLLDKISFDPLLMFRITLLPKGVKSGETPNTIMVGPPDQVIVDEGNTETEKSYKMNKVIYFALNPYECTQKDIKDRDTFGLYGRSILEPIEDIIYKYLNLVEGYTEFVRKYGIGRYFINYKVLEQLIIDGRFDEAKQILADLRDDHKYIKENEDIVGTGFEIQGLDTGGSNLNVVQFKESLETDMIIGLLQQPLTMGKGQGVTYASGYVSEADRLVVIEALQVQINRILNAFIDYRLIQQNKKAGTVWVELEEVSKPKIEFRDLLDAYANGVVSINEVRSRMGLPDSTTEPLPIQQQQMMLQAKSAGTSYKPEVVQPSQKQNEQTQ